MKAIYVKDIKPGTQITSIPFVVIKSEKKVAKNGNEYLDVTLGDKTGTIISKVWREKYDACSADALLEGVIILASGTSNEFNGKVQMVLSMAVVTDKFEEEDFVPVTSKNIEELFEYVMMQADTIKDTHLKSLINNMMHDAEFVKVFKRTPAAMKHHHAYVGGLLEHVTEMLKFAIPMCESYQPCNIDLVKAGIILHDIGKTEEIVWKNMAIEYSDRGKLIGHIQLGLQIIEKYKHQGFDNECLQLLQHIILAHHGKLEYGSVVVPATIEAKIVSLADDASAKLRGYMNLFEESYLNGSSFSEYNKSLETAVYLKEYHSFSEKNAHKE